MQCIVTGGFGFIGRVLCQKLRVLGHEVIIIDKVGPRHDRNIIVDDVRSVNFTQHGLTQPDVIFHLAAQSRIQPSFADPGTSISTNVGGTANILEHARRSFARVIYAGSSSAYGDPNISPYSCGKHLGEELCDMYAKCFKVPTAIARFFNVYGEGETPNDGVVGIFRNQLKNGKSVTITGDGTQRRDFVNVEDIADGLIAMSKRNWFGEVFNLGNGKNYSINEVADMLGAEKQYIPAKPGEAQETLADISFTTSKTGWTPKHDLAEYLEQYKVR